MHTYSKPTWAISVFVMASLVFGQIELSALAAAPDGLSIAIANDGQRQADQIRQREIVVDVRTAEGPASGAQVEFTLPETGPGGRFTDGGLRVTVQADDQGRARSGQILANSVPGAYLVAVQASQGGATAGAAVPQTNPPAEPRTGFFQRLKNWKVLAALGAAGAIVVGVLVTRKDKAAEVTVGVPSIGSPR